VPVISRIDGLQGEDNLKNYLNKEKRSVMDAEVSLLVINYEAALMKFFRPMKGCAPEKTPRGRTPGINLNLTRAKQ
jgi:hypothetical protein